MKKLVRLSIPAFLIAAFVCGTIGFASAQTLNTSVKSKADAAVLRIDTKTQAEINATIKAESTRCASLSTDDQRNSCLKQIEAKVQAKYQAAFPGSNTGGANTGGTDPQNQVQPIVTENEQPNNSLVRDWIENHIAGIERALKGFAAVHDRITKLADRIESRIKKLSSDQVDVTVALKFVAAAREDLRLAKVSMASAESNYALLRVELYGKDNSNSANTDPARETNTKEKIVWSPEGFSKCRAAGNAITSGTVAKCRMNGTLYADSTFAYSDLQIAFSDTLQNIQEFRTHLKSAHRNLVQAVASLKPGLNKKINTSGKIQTNTSIDAKIVPVN